MTDSKIIKDFKWQSSAKQINAVQRIANIVFGHVDKVDKSQLSDDTMRQLLSNFFISARKRIYSNALLNKVFALLTSLINTNQSINKSESEYMSDKQHFSLISINITNLKIIVTAKAIKTILVTCFAISVALFIWFALYIY